MRDPLYTKRTRRYVIGGVLTGRTVRTADNVATVDAQVAAGSLTTIDAASFGLFNAGTADDSCSITSGLAVLTSPNNPWTAADVGKAIDVQGAGAAGATLRSRIRAYTAPGSVTLWDNAGTTVAATVSSAGGLAIWGNDLGTVTNIPRSQNEAGTQELSSDAVVTPGSPSSRSVPVRFAELSFNVKDFGALGDGATDDTAKIQAAIAAAQLAGGKVFFPLGSYATTDELLVTKDNVRLVGEALSEALTPGSRIVGASLTKDVVRVSTSVQTISGFGIENLSLYGAGAGATTGAGLHLESVTAGRSILSVSLRSVFVKNCKGHGIHFEATNATGFIFDVKMDSVRTVNNFGAGLRADGLAIEVVASRVYSEANAASQIALVGADQTTAPRGWLFLGYAAASNPATAGTAGVYLENVRDVQAFNAWHESNANAEWILKSCRGVKFDGGRVSQSGTCDGMVIGFSGALAGGNIDVNVPGWTNTSSKLRVDVSQFAGGSFTLPIRLGNSADGAMTQAEVTGYAAAFLPDQIFFVGSSMVTRCANILAAGVTITGTWTTPASLPTFNQRTAANNTTHQRGWWLSGLAGDPLVAAVAPLKGLKPVRVEVVYSVTGGDAGDDVNFALTSQPWPADNTAVAAATAIATTPDAAHDTAAKRSNSAGGHANNRMVLTVTTPAWLAEGEALVVTGTVTEANDASNALSVIVKAVLVYYQEAR